MTEVGTVDPFRATTGRHELYAEMAARGPIHPMTLPSGAAGWLVTGYAECRQALNDPRLVKAPTPAGALLREQFPELYFGLNSHMLQCDGDTHARLRGLVGAVFTRRRVEELAPRITQIATALLDDVEAETDLLRSYAYPLPMTVICELIGVPEPDRDGFREWTTVLAAADMSHWEGLVDAVRSIVGYARQLIGRRRAEPTNDLLSDLVAVRDRGDALSDDELTSMVWLLVAAGHETTVNLIGNGVLALLTRPAQLERLRLHPDLLSSTIEEVLRYDGPIQTPFPLVATADIEIGGVTVAAGEVVLPALLAANRDPQHMETPELLDIARERNPHLGFGFGIHHCLGAPLARLEGRIALAALLDRFPYLRLAVPAEQLRYRPSFLFNGLEELPVRLVS